MSDDFNPYQSPVVVPEAQPPKLDGTRITHEDRVTAFVLGCVTFVLVIGGVLLVWFLLAICLETLSLTEYIGAQILGWVFLFSWLFFLPFSLLEIPRNAYLLKVRLLSER